MLVGSCLYGHALYSRLCRWCSSRGRPSAGNEPANYAVWRAGVNCRERFWHQALYRQRTHHTGLAYYGGLCLHLLGCFPAPYATRANEPPIRFTVLSRVGCNWVCHLFVTKTPPWAGLTVVVIVIVTAQIHQRRVNAVNEQALPYRATPYSGRAWAIAETDATRAAMAISVLIILDLFKSQTSTDLIRGAGA